MWVNNILANRKKWSNLSTFLVFVWETQYTKNFKSRKSNILCTMNIMFPSYAAVLYAQELLFTEQENVIAMFPRKRRKIQSI